MQERHITLLEFATYQSLTVSVGTVPGEWARAIESHLKTNCAECQRAHEFIGSLTGVIRRDRQATPPEALVARARAIFRPPSEAQSLPSSTFETLAKLVFDSFEEPAPVGVRGHFSPNRHVVFDDRGLVVDLRLEADAGTKCQAIAGQLQTQDLDAKELEGLPLMLVAEGRVIECARTTALGEFMFRNVPCLDVSLYVVWGERMVKVPSIPPAVDLR